MAHPSASALRALQLLEPWAPSTKFPHLASFFNLVLPSIPFSAHFGLLTGTHLWTRQGWVLPSMVCTQGTRVLSTGEDPMPRAPRAGV